MWTIVCNLSNIQSFEIAKNSRLISRLVPICFQIRAIKLIHLRSRELLGEACILPSLFLIKSIHQSIHAWGVYKRRSLIKERSLRCKVQTFGRVLMALAAWEIKGTLIRFFLNCRSAELIIHWSAVTIFRLHFREWIRRPTIFTSWMGRRMHRTWSEEVNMIASGIRFLEN